MIQILKRFVGIFVGKFVLKAQTIPIGKIEGLRYWLSRYSFSQEEIETARSYWPEFKRKNNEYIRQSAHNAVNYKRKIFKTNDGVKLDTVEISPLKKNSSEYIIYGWGRNNHYEMYLSRMAKDAVNLNKTIVSFNYRGVGYSEGVVACEHDLVSDYLFQVERLIRAGVNPKKIQCYGHSLGGAVATIAVHELAQQGIKLKLFNDRSFGNLIDTSVALFFKRRSRRRRFVTNTTMLFATIAIFPMMIFSAISLPILIFSWLAIAAATLSDRTHFLFDSTVGLILEKSLEYVMHFGGWYMNVAPKYDSLPLKKKTHMLIHQPEIDHKPSRHLGKANIATPSEDRVIFYPDSIHNHAKNYQKKIARLQAKLKAEHPSSKKFVELKNKLVELNMVKVSGGDHTADPAELKTWYPHHSAKRHITGQERMYDFFDPKGNHCAKRPKKYKSH